MSILGAFWGLGRGRIFGWVCDTSCDKDLLVTLLADGRELGSAWARRRVVVAGLPVGAREFDLLSTLSAPDTGEAWLQVSCDGIVFASAHHTEGAALTFGRFGVVEEIGRSRLGGWALDLGRPDQPLTIDVRAGALWIGAVQTLIPRPDVQARFGVTQPCGFSFTIPAPLRGEHQTAMRLFIANTNVELKGGGGALNVS